MKIKFCGAAREVTGSAHLITLEDGFTILLDCGLYQGNDKEMEDFNSNWLFDPSEVDCLVLSHAHIDHSGRIPKLCKDGFNGNIYCTHATRSLCAIMLLDSAHIQEKDAEYYNKRLIERNQNKKKNRVPENELELKDPLYTSKDVSKCMEQYVSCSYERWFKINDNVKVLFRDAGHILGSATVTLFIREGDRTIRLGFSGDVGRPDRPILRDPKKMPEVDYLICESTYADRLHEEKPAEEKHFLEVIRHTCVEKKGKLIIPAFSVGRTQEIVYMLDKLENEGKLPHIQVYVDSPLAVNATLVYGSHPECFDDDLNEYMLIDENPFGFNRLSYVRSVSQSKAINKSTEPAIIISASGMMNAGRVRHHLNNNIESPKNTVLIVGYCAPHTTGGLLRQGAEELKLFGEWKDVKADIEIMDSFSAHADQRELMDFVSNQKSIKKMFLVHGVYESQQVLKGLLKTEMKVPEVEIPELGSEYTV